MTRARSESIVLRRTRSGMVSLLILGLTTSWAHAWSRAPHEDSEVVARSELIVVGHLMKDSIEYVPHTRKPWEGASHEHHTTLIVTEVLKGEASAKEIALIIHYGLTPVVGGYVRRDNFMYNLRGRRENYPRDIIEILDTSWGVGGANLGLDAGKDNLWFLRRRSGTYGQNPSTGPYGIVDPEDLQPLARKPYFLAYLSDDPEQAVRRQMANDPAIRERAQRYLDHREVQRILALEDPRQRAEKLLPYFLNGARWGLTSEVERGIVACGDVAGPLLFKPFHESTKSLTRNTLISMWGQMRYRGCVQTLTDLLNEHEAYWAKQDLPRGWWSIDVESALTQRRRDVYCEVDSAVNALGQIGDVRAREAVEFTRRRWRATALENAQIVETCDRTLEVFAKDESSRRSPP